MIKESQESVLFFASKDKIDVTQTGNESGSVSCGKEGTVLLDPAFLIKDLLHDKVLPKSQPDSIWVLPT